MGSSAKGALIYAVGVIASAFKLVVPWFVAFGAMLGGVWVVI